MDIKLYQYLMARLESFKPIGNQRSGCKFIRVWRAMVYYLVSYLENLIIYKMSPICRGENESKGRTQFIVASLTTFPARIKEVRYAVISLMLQTVPPDKIVLWLANDQFPDKKIPDNLMDLCDYGLDVRFCADLRSHKKYYYALQEQKKDEVVITFDDDIIYHPHTIERLINKHNESPGSIICSQGHYMSFDEKGKLMPYGKWPLAHDGMDSAGDDFMPLTGSGCLYPHGIMPSVTFDECKIKELAFTADDLWIGIIAKVSGVSVCPVEKVSRLFTVVGGSQIESLSQVNCVGDGNDVALFNLQKEFNFSDR